MVRAAILSILLFAAPETDPARKMLRVAWASQYEWKEDKVTNATFDFEWSRYTKTKRNEEFGQEVQGTVVIADGKVQRIHLTKGSATHKPDASKDIGWVIRRFIRKSFEESFKDLKFEAPEVLADGNTLLKAGWYRVLVRDDRIVGRERNVGTPQKPQRIRVTYKLGELGEGYAVLGEDASYTHNSVKTTDTHRLEVGKEGAVPVPTKYVHNVKDKAGTRKTTLLFSGVRLNAEHPVVVDTAARDRVKAAWDNRYTWPVGIRFEGKWLRDLDRATEKGGWAKDARGEFQLFSGELEVRLDDSLRWRQGRKDNVTKWVKRETEWAFNLMRPRPFDESFAGCGFEPAPDDPTVIRVLGHPTMRALRIVDGAFAGHLSDEFGAEGWWNYKLKKARTGGGVYVERMTRKIGKRRYTMKFSFFTKKGIVVFKSFERVVAASPFGGDPGDVGVIKFKLSKLLVELRD